MLRQAKELRNYKLRTSEGDIGVAREIYFDEKDWTIRYLVVNTGRWLPGRKILISPNALQPMNGDEQIIPVNLSRRQIEDSPSLRQDQPITREFELAYAKFYRWPFYDESAVLGGNPTQKLHCMKEVTDLYVQALDGEIGHIVDLRFDDTDWTIHFMTISTENWLPGMQVHLSPQWIEKTSWSDSMVFINLSREVIQRSPEYFPQVIHPDYVPELSGNFDRQPLWVELEKTVQNASTTHKVL